MAINETADLCLQIRLTKDTLKYDDDITTADLKKLFKNYLKSQYNVGTPITVYYQLATPQRLAFTDEQKAVAKKLNNARTYKGVTHIYSNDAVSPNCYVEAVKDLTTLIQ